MFGTLFLAAISLSWVGFVLWLLWRYENSLPIGLEKGKIVEKKSIPYTSSAHPPRYGFPFRPPLEEEWGECYFLRLRFKELGEIKVEVDRKAFGEAEEGMAVAILYKRGRLTGRLIRIFDLTFC